MRKFSDNAQLRQQIEDELRALSQYAVIVDEQRWRECYISSDGLYTVAMNILRVMDACGDKRAEEAGDET